MEFSLSFLTVIGAGVLQGIQGIGRFFLFSLKSLTACFLPKFFFRQILAQFFSIGYLSLPVVGLTAIFTGMVLALQSYTGFSRFSAEGSIASVVVLSVTRELGPVLAGLMVTGRIGASIAAEIGTMRVTEQIDALRTLSTDPFHYLIAPRLWGGILMVPLLVLAADAIGVFGGYLIAVHKLGFNPAFYLDQTFRILQAQDITSGLTKAAVFGGILTLSGCYFGYFSKGGAQGVGRATNSAVVTASILILITNYFMTALFFSDK